MSDSVHPVCVIGAGLAGSECAYQLAKRGITTTLVEMRPAKSTPAHRTAGPAELVCSNSLRSNDVMNAVGLLKEEMAALDSLIVRAAHRSRVPAGSALAVDREAFSAFVSASLGVLPALRLRAGEAVAIEREGDAWAVVCDGGERIICRRAVIATGPLTSDGFSRWIAEAAGVAGLYFYDAIAPIIEKDSIDMNAAFCASRWGKGEEEGGDYINCPMDKAGYERFVADILAAELAPVHDGDEARFFEGCLPVEVMAARGLDVLRHGPMKPMGLRDPRSPDLPPYAVVQLRRDNLHATLYNMVGFQTRMKHGFQQKVFRAIPGLAGAVFARYGAMHRNTFIRSPMLLGEGMELKSRAGIHFAGQITGCEGYTESAAVGLFVAMYLVERLGGTRNLARPPATTALGALLRHILRADPSDYQPMNVNFGLFDPFDRRPGGEGKKAAYVSRAFADFRRWIYDAGMDD